MYVSSNLNGRRTLGHLLLPRALKFCSLPMSKVTGLPALWFVPPWAQGLRAVSFYRRSGVWPLHPHGRICGKWTPACVHCKGLVPGTSVFLARHQGRKVLTFSDYNFQDEDGLFYVESTLVVRDASTEAVSCFIHNPSLAEKKGSDVSIPGQCSASRIKMLPLVGKVEGTVL